MVWKNDLAKLKKEFKETEELKPKSPVPKAAPKPDKFLDIQDEDALFLMAMGKKPKSVVSKPTVEVLEMEEAEKAVAATHVKSDEIADSPKEDFHSAMSFLKGIKPTKAKNILEDGAEKTKESTSKDMAKETQGIPEVLKGEVESVNVDPKISQLSLNPQESAVQEEIKLEFVKSENKKPENANFENMKDTFPAPEQRPCESKKTKEQRPTLIHLAAGMAVDVDGCMDLRGHSISDAIERLSERIQDGACLGWRTFHITLGQNEELREAFLAFIKTDCCASLTRYAQAPIPMGGNQAWILYYPSH